MELNNTEPLEVMVMILFVVALMTLLSIGAIILWNKIFKAEEDDDFDKWIGI